MANTEVEFAACLLSCGGPTYLKQSGHNHDPLSRGSVLNRRMTFPITSADYMFAVAAWYDKTIGPFETAASDSIEFTKWWVSYKAWLVENWHG